MAREVEKEYITTGKVQLVYVDFVVHQEALLAAEAAHCAGQQDAFWAYHDLLFDRQFEQELTPETLKQFATDLELDMDKFNACLDQNTYRDFVIAQTQQSKEMGLQGTPSFVVRPTFVKGGGQFIPGLVEFEQMKEVIEEQLAVAAGEAAPPTPASP